MAGGYIFQKTIGDGTSSAFQGGSDKSLLIEPNYAYQVNFGFSDWTDIKIGMFVSYVATGDTDEARNSGVLPSLVGAGGTSLDTFNYVGIMKSGAASDDPSLPLTDSNSGFLGMQGDRVLITGSTQKYYNKIMHVDEISAGSDGDSRFIATNGSTTLQSKEFNESKGNFNVVGLDTSTTFNPTSYADPSKTTNFADYWGMRFEVLNKNLPNQKIRFTASMDKSSNNSTNSIRSDSAISDPSMSALKLLINGVGESEFNSSSTNMHSSSNDGFVWNNGSAAYALPDSLFFYNAFQNIRPRIHAWAIKKIS